MTAPSRPALPLSLINRDRFLELFYDSASFEVYRKAVVHLHMLRIDAGEFTLARLYTELANATLGYVLSRQNMQKLRDDPSRTVEFVNKVQSQFKEPDANNGEGGEVLLYAFLEGYLGAPKILSKMELKTSPNHYVHGADGVHLLKVEEGDYQLIFGESKMYGDLTGMPGTSVRRAVRAAFKSMGEVQKGAFQFDTWLVQSELLKENLDQDTIDVLASILLPSAEGDHPIRKSNAFGVFIGYEVDVTSVAFENLSTAEIEESIRTLAQDLVEQEIRTIAGEISDRGLGAYHFHIYAVPFLKRQIEGKDIGIRDVRFDLARALRNGRAEGI